MSWLQDPIATALLLPPFLVPLLVFGSALLEYVFPPWWGDTLILLGFFLAAQGGASPGWIFAAAVGGSMVGSIAAYGLGRRYGVAIVQRIVHQRRRSESWGRTQELFQRFGERVVVLNRFLPFVRGVMLYAAGALKMRFWPTVIYCTLSNMVFVTLLMWLGLKTADSWESLTATARDANRWLGIAALAIVGVWIAVVLVRARARRRDEGGDEGEEDDGS